MSIDYNGLPDDRTLISVFYNALGFHSIATALVYSDQALLRYFTNTSYVFAAANHPLPQSPDARIKAEVDQMFIGAGDSFTYSINLMFGFAFLSASFVFFLITERSRYSRYNITHNM